jgi:hypothetical protein
MPKNQDSLNVDLARQLKRYRPTMRDTSGKVVPIPEEAEVFQFHFVMDGEDYGTVTVSIDGLHKLVVYYGDSVEDSPNVSANDDLSWTQLLLKLKNFAHQHQLSFELSDQDDLEGDMAKREHNKKLDESYHALNKKTSYNDSIPAVKVRIQHTRDMQEGEQRFRNVAKIFIENADGERILAPTTKPGVAKLYARHIAEGGKPHDDRWNHINSLVEEYTKMAGFVRATRNGQFNEATEKLVTEGVNHYLKLRETLHKMIGKKGYNTYFESWNPPLMEDEVNEDLSSMFMSSSLDPRIESAMPILSKLNKNIVETKLDEVDAFESWANKVIEGSLTPRTPAQLDDLVDILGQDELPFGADAINVKNQLSNILQSDELYSELARKAKNDPDADARSAVVDWMSKQNNPEYKSVLSKLTQKLGQQPAVQEADEEADYGPEYQAMVARVGQKAKEQEKKKPTDIKDLAARLNSVKLKDEPVKEAGPAGKPGDYFDDETVTTGRILGNKPQSQKGLRGKLVGEGSVDPAIERIRKLSGLNK